jgi:hypothetical protein
MATENKEFYFRVLDDGDAMVMVIDANGNYSQHMSTDATEDDGDGAFGPYHWNESQAWTKTTREHAESMLQFTFTDNTVDIATVEYYSELSTRSLSGQTNEIAMREYREATDYNLTAATKEQLDAIDAGRKAPCLS